MTNVTAERTANGGVVAVLATLFIFRGRANRAKYWLVSLICALILVVANLADYAADASAVAIVSALVAAVVATIVNILVSIRRLHDRDKSGHWMWLFYGVPLVLGLVAEVFLLQTAPRNQSLVFGLRLVEVGFIFWAFVELGCLPGTRGPNRFGPDPLART